MFSFSGGNKQFNMNLRYRDFFIDFLACLIPGFLFLVLSITIIVSTIYLFFKFIPYNGTMELFLSVEDLLELKNIIYFPFWIHVSIFILSFMFGFFLYRQDPKKPDHVSYLRNRETVKGYNEWVIKNTEGLSPIEVQFPYCNLSAYLSSRGFDYDKDIINWDCDKEGESGNKSISNQKNRSKAFINKLKMRISFFYPEALSTIIKNEAHIRFSSSMWYGLSVIIKLLYGATLLLIIYENFILYKYNIDLLKSFFINIANIVILLLSAFAIRNKYYDYKIYDQEHKSKESFIDDQALKLTKIYRMYDMVPFVSSIAITSTLYMSIHLNVFDSTDYAYLLLLDACLVSVLAFFIFYAKQKIETSFHYQRVREIIYVIEVANMAKVIKDSDIQNLLEKKNYRENGPTMGSR